MGPKQKIVDEIRIYVFSLCKTRCVVMQAAPTGLVNARRRTGWRPDGVHLAQVFADKRTVVRRASVFGTPNLASFRTFS